MEAPAAALGGPPVAEQTASIRLRLIVPVLWSKDWGSPYGIRPGGRQEMTERNLSWRKTLLVAYENFGGEADNVSITNFIVDLIKWDGDWNKLHIQLSKYRAHLAEAGHIERVRHPSAKRPGSHRLTPAGREVASGVLSNEGAIPD